MPDGRLTKERERLRSEVDAYVNTSPTARVWTGIDAAAEELERKAVAVATLDTAERLIGQDGDLLFAVRVKGLGAMPDSPQSIARELCSEWSANLFRGLRFLDVELNDGILAEARAALTPIPTAGEEA